MTGASRGAVTGGWCPHTYSAAIRSGDLLFVSGQVGSRSDGSPEPDFEGQVRLAFANLEATLQAGGCGLDDIVDVTTFHTDPENQFGTIMTVKSEVFPDPPYPNWTALGVNWLAGFDFEIKVIARIPGRSRQVRVAGLGCRRVAPHWGDQSGHREARRTRSLVSVLSRVTMITRRNLLVTLPHAVSVAASPAGGVVHVLPTSDLDEAMRVLASAFSTGDVERIVAMHAERAFVVYGNGPHASHADLRRTWDSYFTPKVGTGGVSFRPYHPVVTDHVEAAGDVGFTRGRYWHGEVGSGPEKYRGGGYFLAYWKRDQRGWRVIAFNATATQKVPRVADRYRKRSRADRPGA